MTLPDFARASMSFDPFPHCSIREVIGLEAADEALRWLRNEAPWTLRVESFYQQHEFSLLTTELGPGLADFARPAFVEAVREELERRFEVEEGLELVDVSAHRLTDGQTIRIHNDFIEGHETHRLLIQLNNGWSAERGGLLMLFAGEASESIRHVLLPTHASGFAFEISPVSFHAVSSVRNGERYTLVYTFRRPTSAA